MIPNLISLYRIICIPFFIWYLREGRISVALIIFITSVISDFLDGYLARKMPKQNPAGAILDPVADKFLLMSSFFCLFAFKSLTINIPFWVLLTVISRDLIVIIGTGIIFVMGVHVEVKPSMLGKLTTFFQMGTILSVLLSWNYSFILWQIAVVFTVFSGLQYILRGVKAVSVPKTGTLS